MKIIVFSLFLIQSVAYSKILDLDFKIKHKENSITSTMNNHVAAKLGESFTMRKHNIEAVFSAVEKEMRPFGKSGKTVIEYNGKIYKFSKGVRQLIASPRVISPLGEDASLRVNDSVSGEALVLSLKANGFID